MAFRLVPLTFSPLPYNIDGFPLARIADDIASTGSWRIDESGVNSYNEKMPGFSLLWSAIVQVGALDALAHVQPVLALMTSTIVWPVYLIALKATGRRLAAVAAALVLSIFGSFLMLTSTVTKESLGLVLFPMTILLFHGRADPRKRALAVSLLVLLPFVHHLTSLLALGGVAALVVLNHRRAFACGRFTARAFAADLVSLLAPATLAYGYYRAVSMPILGDVTTPDAIGLFLAIVVLMTALLAPTWRPARLRRGRTLVSPASHVVLVPAIGIAALALNAQTSVFAGVEGTRPGFLQILPAIAIVAGFALVGYQLVRRTTGRLSDLLLAMLVAPTALVLFGFLRGLDPLSLVIVYRAVDFLDFGIAILAGSAFAYVWRGLGPWRPLAGAVFFGALLATTPMAWDTPRVFGVENVTTHDEFQALAFLSDLGATNVTTDQRLADVGAWWFDLRTDRSLPLKLRDGEAIVGPDYALVLERWTTVGAQVHPAPNIVLDREILDAFLRTHSIVYVTGPPSDRILILRVSAPANP